MSDQRWTEGTREQVAAFLDQWFEGPESADEGSETLLTLLADLGLLVEPGGETHTEELRTAVRKLGHGLIAVSPLLDKPYSDAPEWTPWRRFVAPRLAEVRRLVGLERPTPTSSEEPT